MAVTGCRRAATRSSKGLRAEVAEFGMEPDVFTRSVVWWVKETTK